MSTPQPSFVAVDSVGNTGYGGGEFMLFGVRVMVDPMRKSVSMNNLSQYEQTVDNNKKEDGIVGNGGYGSADDAVPRSSPGGSSKERKRGVPWTEEEHKLFLLGLQKVGKGDWRGISRNFVKTRTPTQVASHAQKYFLRRNNHSRRRRRSSLFDITTDTVAPTPMEEEQVTGQENSSQSHSLPPPPPQLDAYNFGGFTVSSAYPVTIVPAMMPVPIENPMESLTLGHGNESNSHGRTSLVHPVPDLRAADGKMISDLDLNLNSQSLALQLSLPSDDNQSPRHPTFQAVSGYSNGDSIISVA